MAADQPGAILMLVNEQRVFINQNNHTWNKKPALFILKSAGSALQQAIALWPFVWKLVSLFVIAWSARYHNIPRIVRAALAGYRDNVVCFVSSLQFIATIIAFTFLTLILVSQILSGIFTAYTPFSGIPLTLVNGCLLPMLFFVASCILSRLRYVRLIVFASLAQYQLFVNRSVFTRALFMFFRVNLIPVTPISRMLLKVFFVIGKLALLALFVQNALLFISIKEELRCCGVTVGAFGTLPHRSVLGYSVHAVRPQFLSSRLRSVSALAGANIITSSFYHISPFKAIKGGCYAQCR